MTEEVSCAVLAETPKIMSHLVELALQVLLVLTIVKIGASIG